MTVGNRIGMMGSSSGPTPPTTVEGVCFEAVTAGSTVSIVQQGSNPNPVSVVYSTGGAWSAYTIGTVITLAAVGDKVYFKSGGTSHWNTNQSSYTKFAATGSVDVSGNVMYLIDETGQSTSITGANEFFALFSGCAALRSVSYGFLPATTLSANCYSWLAMNCTSLTSAPALPAMTLAPSCYSSMFQGCSSLATAPALPATTLDSYCYQSMFSSCLSLATAPALPATTIAAHCYYQMFSNCTFTEAPSLPATTLASNCYANMFRSCSRLATPPVLPSTTMAASCYSRMFEYCRSLVTPPALPATTLADSCYQYMFGTCSSLATAPALPATELANSCYMGMFSDCTALTTAPVIQETGYLSGTSSCQVVFKGCSSLSSIRVRFSKWMPSAGEKHSTDYWVQGVASSGTFTCPSALPEEYGDSRIPTGWTVVRE